jgi:hypothetical protein
LLHIGAPKSGTSFLQAVLMRNRALLAEQGVLMPPGSWSVGQVQPVVDLLGPERTGELARKSRGAWARFVSEVEEYDGRAVLLSMEFLAKAKPQAVEKAVADLAGTEVHVVITARDLGRQFPATWQESVQNGAHWTWNRFVKACATEPGSPPSRHFSESQDIARMARTWSEFVPPERIHVVTIPRSGPPTELWTRFCKALEIDGDAFDLDVPHNNPSLGASSAEVMRLVNKRSGKVDRTTYLVFKHTLAKSILAGRGEPEPRVTVPHRFRPWIVETSKEMVGALRELNPHVIGDLDDLVADFAGQERDPWPDDRAVLEAAVDGLIGLSRELAELRRAQPEEADADEQHEQHEHEPAGAEDSP